MLFLALAIFGVWVALFAAAYLTRLVSRRSRRFSAATVGCTYLVLAGMALVYFGLNRSGYLAGFGMLLPAAVAIGMVGIYRPRL